MAKRRVLEAQIAVYSKPDDGSFLARLTISAIAG